MTPNKTYVVAGAKPWNLFVFKETIYNFPGEWHFVACPGELTPSFVDNLAPRYIFFLHWSWKLDPEITNNYECVGFHMTDLPYGRGGSPLQNLIASGRTRTKLTALRMNSDFDAGPIYMKEDLSLEGSAEEIYVRATNLSAQMIRKLIKEEPKPKPQEGEPTFFKRRNPNESKIPQLKSIQELHNFIRMLDADTYPRAFLEHEGFRYELGRAQLLNSRIVANVTITPVEEGAK